MLIYANKMASFLNLIQLFNFEKAIEVKIKRSKRCAEKLSEKYNFVQQYL